MLKNNREQPDDLGGQPLPPTDLDQLRQLLVGRELGDLADLRDRVQDPQRRIHDVSEVLAEAVAARNTSDTQLASQLAPTIEDSLKAAVRRNPKSIADAIFPIIGPAIRKSIAEALSRMVQSLNQVVEHSLSPRSIRWRFEAWRTGRPFAEVVLLHTLIYRVEHVFLVHRESGLLLQHVADDAAREQDGDLISGMLTAISDFVSDSFGTDPEQPLDALRVGELTVWVLSGPQAYVAAVIQGTAPATLRTKLEETIETIHGQQVGALESFTGDVAAFDSLRPVLQSCLTKATRQPARRKPLLAWVILGAAALALTLWCVSVIAERSNWHHYLAKLRAEPGIVVTEVKTGIRGYTVRGLRDPLARDPSAILGETDLDPAKVGSAWELFHAAHPEIVLARAHLVLQPPEQVTLRHEDGVLWISGTAGAAWIERQRQLAATLAGVNRVIEQGLVAADAPPSPDPPEDEGPSASEVLQRVRSVLNPPAGVSIDFHEGTLILAGSARTSWIAEAPLLARTVAGVREVHADNLRAGDSAELTLAEAARLLRPPERIRLRLEDGTLVAEGSASHAWIERARLLGPVVPGVQDFELNVVDEDLAEILTARAHVALRPPATVDLRVEGTVLVASGSAPHRWLADARRLTPLIPGLSLLREDSLIDLDVRRLDAARQSLERRKLYFRLNGTELAPGQEQEITAVIDALRELLDAAESSDATVRVGVTGHSNASGGGSRVLCERRARAVIDMLVARGTPAAVLSVGGSGDPGAENAAGVPAAKQRRVTFAVSVEGTADR